MIPEKLTARHYYAFDPPIGHRTGDIWMNLPTHGLLRCDYCSGLVITPACDLANEKVETITYLPILPITKWLCTVAFLPTIRGLLVSLLQQMKIEGAGELLPRFRTPEPQNIAFLRQAVAAQLQEPDGKKHAETAARCVDGLDHIQRITSAELPAADCAILTRFLGKKWQQVCEDIITNSFSNDLHFLPRDGQPLDWSSVPHHGVVLFRYPITCPADILDLAQDVAISDWPVAVEHLAKAIPFVRSFRGKRPLKTLSLRTDFLGDLLTRYVGLYVRLGSPDFSRDTVAAMSAEIGGV